MQFHSSLLSHGVARVFRLIILLVLDIICTSNNVHFTPYPQGTQNSHTHTQYQMKSTNRLPNQVNKIMNTTSLINTSCIIYSPNATRHAKREENGSTSKANDLDQFFFFECFTSQSMTESMLVEFLHDIMKHATSRSVIVFNPL
jgi:hypothetical protein